MNISFTLFGRRNGRRPVSIARHNGELSFVRLDRAVIRSRINNERNERYRTFNREKSELDSAFYGGQISQIGYRLALGDLYRQFPEYAPTNA